MKTEENIQTIQNKNITIGKEKNSDWSNKCKWKEHGHLARHM